MQHWILFVLGAICGSSVFYYIAKKTMVSQEVCADFEIKKAEYVKDIEARDRMICSFQDAVASLESKISEYHKKISDDSRIIGRLESEKIALQRSVDDNDRKQNEAFASWRKEVEHRTNAFVSEESKVFESHIKERLLRPLEIRLEALKTQQDNHKGELNQRLSDMLVAKDNIVSQAENLANVFKKDYKAQGSWGEIVLEKILEEAGLKKGVNYSVQPTVRSENGERFLRPDIKIDLPENQHIIIDSKVSLVHCEKFFAEVDASKKDEHKKCFLSSVRKQIDELSDRQYQKAKGVNSPDFVLMFVPIENAYFLAISADESLHAYAWNKKRVALVSVSTLMITISVISKLLSLDKQNQNVKNIIDEAEKLYAGFTKFVEDMSKTGDALSNARVAFDASMRRLDGNIRGGSLIKRVDRLREYGIGVSDKDKETMLKHQVGSVDLEANNAFVSSNNGEDL